MENPDLKNRIRRIEKMESILADHKEVTERFADSLEEFKNSYQKYIELSHYYSSAEYMDDLQAQEENLLPEDLSTAVLAEDYVYDLLGDNRLVMIEIIKLAGLMAEEP